MRIKINGLEDERFHRPLQNIANLFFEESEILLLQNGTAEMEVAFEWKATEIVFARSELVNNETSKRMKQAMK